MDIQDVFGGGAFDTSEHEAQGDFSVLPPGKYTVAIEKAEVKQTKAKDGHYVWLQLSVVGEKFANRKLFHNINIDNPNETATKIGLGVLSALGKAVNGGQDTKIQSVDQLLGQVVVASVAVKGDQNEIRTYLPNGAAPAAPQTQQPRPPFQQPATQQAASAQSVPPWKR